MASNGNGIAIETVAVLRKPPVTKAKRGRSSVTNLLATAFVSGIVCYRLGMFAGCASPWMLDIQSMHGTTFNADSPALYNNAKIPDPKDDRRFVQRPSTPYDCGTLLWS